MDINDLKIALADLYLANIEKNKEIVKLTKAGESLFKELEELKKKPRRKK